MKKLADIQKLRAFAILMVLFGHTPLAIPGVLLHGYTGVSLFFVISGYVVTLSFIRRPPVPSAFVDSKTWAYLRDFWVRRVFRILPVAIFWVVASIGIVEVIARLGGTVPWTAGRLRELTWLLTGAYNYRFAAAHVPALFGHFWSLAVEMHFYLLLPILLLAFRKREQRIALCALGVAAVSTLFRLVTPRDQIGFLTHTQADALLMGVLICVLFASESASKPIVFGWEWRVPQWAKNAIFLTMTAALLVLPSQLDGAVSPLLKYPLYTAIASTMVFLAQRDTGWVLGGMPRLGKLMAYVGDRSYSLYLCHPVLWFGVYGFVLARFGGALPHWLTGTLPGVALQFGFLVVVGVLVADLSYRFIEIPFIKQGKGFVALLDRRSAQSAEAPAAVEPIAVATVRPADASD